LCCVFLVGGNTLCCSPSQLPSKISEKTVVLKLVSFDIYGIFSHRKCFAVSNAECKSMAWHNFPLFSNSSSAIADSVSQWTQKYWC
jgi:hypothetical protein